MKDINYYKNVGDYPKEPKKPYLPSQHNSEQAAQYAKDLEVYEGLKTAYNNAKYAYYEMRNALQEEFKNDLFKEHGVTNNSKANLCYSKAWDLGHSAGLEDSG